MCNVHCCWLAAAPISGDTRWELWICRGVGLGGTQQTFYKLNNNAARVDKTQGSATWQCPNCRCLNIPCRSSTESMMVADISSMFAPAGSSLNGLLLVLWTWSLCPVLFKNMTKTWLWMQIKPSRLTPMNSPKTQTPFTQRSGYCCKMYIFIPRPENVTIANCVPERQNISIFVPDRCAIVCRSQSDLYSKVISQKLWAPFFNLRSNFFCFVVALGDFSVFCVCVCVSERR